MKRDDQLLGKQFVTGSVFILASFWTQFMWSTFTRKVFVAGLVLHFISLLVIAPGAVFLVEKLATHLSAPATFKKKTSLTDAAPFAIMIAVGCFFQAFAVYLLQASFPFMLWANATLLGVLFLIEPFTHHQFRNVFQKKSADTWQA
eukprot:TRINITY_DN19661_c0_g1_i1.p2 TRINITY_DN19661_c0_g1~~TRINITY_DN19661_c0_g1_i1.p2  ORF type:complete len:146 (+),score=33.87 TRINITY_DN19661_c0_g1_i1:108-545(+)